ncbi:MAG: CHAT domain-containing protein [Bacteroidia bacterium]|nr:CHAT domain-containing protein [Bacteroidia bacterium]
MSHGSLVAFLGISLYAQSIALEQIDSLAIYSPFPQEVLRLYDSLLSQRLSDTFRLRIYVSSLRPLTSLRWLEQVSKRADSATALALRLRDTLSYLEALSWKAEAFIRQGRFSGAESLLTLAKLPCRQENLSSPVCGKVLHHWANLKYHQGNYREAEKLYAEALSLYEKTLGSDHPDYATTLNHLANTYGAQGRYAEAEKLYIKAKEIRKRVLGPEHPDYAASLNNLSVIYSVQGRYSEAEQLALEVIAIRLRIFGPTHPEYASALNNLALIYEISGRYEAAEKLHLEAKDIRARLADARKSDYAATLSNLALVYYKQGRFAEAEKLLLEAMNIHRQALGTDHPAYITTLNNLAVVYQKQNRYSEAEKLLKEVKDIRERTIGPEHSSYATALNNLAIIYQAQKRYAEAEELLLKAKNIRARTLGVTNPRYAATLYNLALVYYEQGRYAEAESLYLEVSSIQKRSLGIGHPEHIASLTNLAFVYRAQNRYAEADSLLTEVLYYTFQRLRKDFLALSYSQRQKLVENVIADKLQRFQAYVAERGEKAPHLMELGYRAARSFKGILLSSTEAMKYLIESHPSDSLLQALYKEWRSLIQQYAARAAEENYTAADSIWILANQTERRIIERLPEIETFLPDIANEPLYPPIRPHEAIVEVVRVPLESNKGALYLFYLIFYRQQKPTLHIYAHFTDSTWEQRARNAYGVAHSPVGQLSSQPYFLLWSFIDSLIPRQVRVLYFAPDGIYYLINIASLYDGHKFLIDKYDIRYIATSRRLLRKPFFSPKSEPVVIGNPDFRGNYTTLPEGRQRTYRLFSREIPPLPGAEEEAKLIAALLGTHPLIGAEATEAKIKGLRSPVVLHIATHGYFLEGERNGVVESGILLAQASLWDSLFPPLGVEDGRLTAQEASTLNLLGTDLVVLSACETALGEVKPEGFYGLQSAFLEAGAARVITALWQIDDQATKDLMITFYKRWKPTKNKSQSKGEEIDKAFSHTIRYIRKKYEKPYYWAAFILMR